jgi:hypothetical protein
MLFTSPNNMPFDVAASPVITLNFLGLGTDHYAVYIRVNAQTDCTSSPVFKITIGATTYSAPLTANTPTLV